MYKGQPLAEREIIARFVPIMHCLANAIQYYIKSYITLYESYKWLPSSGNPSKYSLARDYLSKDMADPSPERKTIARFVPITHRLANAIQYYIKSYSNLANAIQYYIKSYSNLV
jgi:hypothetical protein